MSKAEYIFLSKGLSENNCVAYAVQPVDEILQFKFETKEKNTAGIRQISNF